MLRKVSHAKQVRKKRPWQIQTDIYDVSILLMRMALHNDDASRLDTML